MSFDIEKFKQALVDWQKATSRASACVEGEIVEVNDDYTCDVKVGTDGSGQDVVFYSVPIKVLVGTPATVIEVPVLGSDCLLLFKDNNIHRPQLLCVDQVDKFLINPKTVTQFNNGLLGGMVKAKELQEQSNKDKAILDTLLQIINGPPITELGNGAPSALQIALKSALAGKQSGTWDNLENSKILQ